MWRLALADRDGTSIGELPYVETLTLTRKLNDTSTLEVTCPIDPPHTVINQLRPGRHVRMWRGGTLRHYGIIEDSPKWEFPAGTDAPATVTLRVSDPSYQLGRQMTRATIVATSVPTQVTAREAITSWLDFWPAWAPPLYVANADLQTCPQRTLTIERGENVLDVVKRLSHNDETDGGFWWRIDPYDGTQSSDYVAGKRGHCIGRLFIRYPSSGTDRPTTRIEFGTATAGTAAAATIEQRLPVNHVRGTANALSIDLQDTTSIGTHGMWSESVSPPDAKELAEIQKGAQAKIKPEIRGVVTITPSRSSPLLWDDFEVGDTLRVSVRHAPFDLVDQVARVTEAVVKCDGRDEWLDAITVDIDPLVLA